MHKFCVKILFCKHYFGPFNTFLRKGTDPDPYLWLMDPDPGVPKTCGSGSPTLFPGVRSSNVNDIEMKGQTFRYRSLLSEREQNVLVWFVNYRNERKTYWFGLKIVLGKVERFYLIQKLIYQGKSFSFGRLIIGMKAKQFVLVCLLSKLIIGTKPKRFDLVRLLSEQNRNILICSKIV